MMKEVLIVLLQWVDPSVQVCAPVEAPEAVERADERSARAMEDMGKPQPGRIVDPWGSLSDAQREALERGARRSGGQ
ncbi:hypothetical protein JL101_036555 (plasmid) [Skermanella rosea]|uniref:hypothetical protein n=1 Tax=Skermanella rosea TaxID=1817965 RepID=UPI001933E0B7|nr:hypothetical protein [Skermanella rosea]UEM08212.1 hypothetical protein JL101_036555 [Skermanella rosea]